MLRNIFFYGVIAGVIVAIPTFGLTVLLKDHPPEQYGLLIGYTTMLVALSAIFVAIKRHRDVEGGGVIRFWPALMLGLGVSVVAGVFYCVAWEAALAVTGMDFGADYAQAYIEAEKAKGVSGAALAKLTAEMEAFKVQYANPLYRVPMTFTEIFPLGVLVSLVSAALLRNSRFLPARGAVQ
ncbi:MAG: DUF4199 domain-containing protein [Sphingomonas sp.]|uniref:DUF4199 domain-containing protein n=1 Tax=Sphingomonas sp. TaxID=28214 RepID=UPI0025D5203D|nr:DUF4199 domain-containing protein [Sphingomonas sp.]MBY0284498.1 DUF4199 domain-containing protein [Sphingomonas sp.]